MRTTAFVRHVERLRGACNRIAAHLEIAAQHDDHCATFEKGELRSALQANAKFMRGEASLLRAAANEGVGE